MNNFAPYEPHDHAFGQDEVRQGELRTLLVIGITVATMGIEIAAGLAYGSMALLADGLHMGSHAAALGVAYFAYVFARRHAHDERFSFGTGKVNALGGFVGALLLAEFSLFMIWESGERLLAPVEIGYNMAMLVAVAGLVVNLISALILGHDHGHGDHEHGHGESCGHEHDHNLRSAYLHVLADALTSVLAIVALAAAKFLGWVWLDPAIGILGAVLIARWSWSLIRSTAGVLLDRQASVQLQQALAEHVLDGSSDQVADLHVWSIGPGIYAAEIAIVSTAPEPAHVYRQRIPSRLGIQHVSIEVHNSPRSQNVEERGSE